VIRKRDKVIAILVPVIMLIAGCGDNIEVPPGDGSINETEYVSVRNEPQHRHRFENEWVRMYDVLLPPKHVTLYHAHIQDTIYVTIHGSRLKSKSLVGFSMPIALPIPSGMVHLTEHKKAPSVHQVTNSGDGVARLVGVELKKEATEFVRKPVVGHGLKLKDTYAKVRVYELNLAPGESTGRIESGFTGLIISLTKASVSSESENMAPTIESFEPASWEWFDEASQMGFRNVGSSPFEAVLYELP